MKIVTNKSGDGVARTITTMYAKLGVNNLTKKNGGMTACGVMEIKRI